jgi:hypothetical protein
MAAANDSIAVEDYPVPVNPLSRRLETVDLLCGLLNVLHIYLLHSVATLVTLAVVGNVHAMIGESAMDVSARGWGVHLAALYAIWLSAVAVLYWPCRWFSRFKARRRDWWLSYL